MKTEISLSGKWLLTGKDASGKSIELPVQVPGYVLPTLQDTGLIPPIFWRDNAKQCQWVEKVEWTFSHIFKVPPGQDLSRAELHFGGIDTFADIYLNEKHIGSAKNMFVPLRLQVAEALRTGRNSLKVVIHPYATMIEDKRLDYPSAFDATRVHVRRVQCTFLWDWVERFISAGIWKDVKLVFPEASTIVDVFVYTQDIAPTSASLIMKLHTQGAMEQGCRFAVDIKDPDGKLVWNQTGRVFSPSITLQADLPDVRLWWPNGYGEQPLYHASFTLYSSDGAMLDRKTIRTGIRTIRFECLRDQPGSPEEARTAQVRKYLKQTDNPHIGESLILLVNGRRIFGKGGNWVPPTPFPGSLPSSHTENLIRLAAEAGMNLLRVWGGGEYELEEFYDLCDQFGIMVLQDFMLSCADYPEDDPEFVANLRQEVHANLLALRNHCSIVCWTGNNENCDGFEWDDPKMTDRALLDEVFLPALAMLDPTRPFRPGSPWGGLKNGDQTVGDCHDSWWWAGAEKITPQHFSMVPRFSSEYPNGGYPLPAAMLKFLSNSDLQEPDGKMLEYHIKNNPFFDKLGWPTVHGRLIRNTQIILGESDTAEQELFHRAYLQYEWVRLVIEGMRRAKWYNSAVLFWMYNDCWPALGYALVDYYGRPKPGWFSAKRAFAPVVATIAEENGLLVFSVLNDSPRPRKLTARILEADTLTGKIKVMEEMPISFIDTASLPAYQNHEILWQALPANPRRTLLFLELWEDGDLVVRARWNAGWLSQLEITPARLSWKRSGNTIIVHCHKGIALGVTFDGNFISEDNCFDLLPGEKRTIRLRPPYGSAKTGSKVTPYAYRGIFV
ncbi:MAG: hypothetical protein IKR13_01540 [Victivallales bacterium]|nr:hypothetical protein [Victivallales bacterium]